MDELNVVIVGVGGQGTLLASRVLGQIAQAKGYDVKVSEVHGMSQRGGSVITYVRMAEKVFSPLVEQKGADFLLAFEELEALRALPYLKDGGTLIVNIQQIFPLPVIIGATEYPHGIVHTLRQTAADTVAVDALGLARSAGSAKALNTVLLGILAGRLSFSKQMWLQALSDSVPLKFLEANYKAFELGYAL
jgi:indolepyruvate ferredoxin oxidoreductase beta subunit